MQDLSGRAQRAAGKSLSVQEVRKDLYAERPTSEDYRALKKWKSKLLRWANIIICVVRLMCGIIRLLFSIINTFMNVWKRR